MTGTHLCVNKPHCAAAVRPWESEATTSTLSPARLEPVQSCLGVARVMSEQQVPRTVWGRMSPTETLFPILLLESVVHFSGRDVFSNEEFDHNALFHAPRYLLFAHHSSNYQTELNRFKPEKEGGWRLWLHSLKVAQLLRSAAWLHTNQSR